MYLAEPEAGNKAVAPAAGAGLPSRFECPVTQLPCEGAPMAALPACGHVLSARAIKQVPLAA